MLYNANAIIMPCFLKSFEGESMLKKTVQFFVLSAILVITVPAQAGWFGVDKAKPLPALELKSGVMMPSAKVLPFFQQQLAQTQQAFYFSDQRGQPFGAQNFQKHWTLVFFGFTYCPMLCPTTMAQLNNAYQQLVKAQFTPLPQIVFMTIDPARDKQKDLAKFIDAFNPHFIGLRTDNEKALSEFARELDAAYEKVNGSGKDKDKKGQYTLTHTGDIAVIDPQGDLVALLTMPHTDKDIAADYQAIIKKLT